MTCTRSDALAPAASYPPITVTVNVASNAAASVTNTATVSGGGEVDSSNDTASDPTTVNPATLIAPTNLIATAISTSQIVVTWDAVTGAASYQVFRKSGVGTYSIVATPTATSFPDSGLAASTTYLYQVRAVSAGSTVGPPSNIDLATTILFTDDPLIAGTTVIKAVHLIELRTAVDAVRGAAALSAATYSHAVASGVRFKAVDVTELRSNLDQARAALALPAIQYTDPGLAVGNIVMAAHIQEVRAGVK
jgi:fibronectin type 3 domain-containing protein